METVRSWKIRPKNILDFYRTKLALNSINYSCNHIFIKGRAIRLEAHKFGILASKKMKIGRSTDPLFRRITLRR